MAKIYPLLLTVVVVVTLSCTPDAPRSNPMDPAHQAAIDGGLKLSGQVLRKTAPFAPLPSCDVYIQPENHFAKTDGLGRFQFTGLSAVDHQLLAHKTGYDSLWVDIPADSLIDSDIFLYLNARPAFNNVRIYSEYIDQWWPEAVPSVIITATVSDADGFGDIDSVLLRMADYDTSYSLVATARPDSFALRLATEDVPGQNLYDIIGQTMLLTVQDKDSSRAVFRDKTLIRFVAPAPVATTPTGLVMASPAPLLEWSPFYVSFEFSYVVSVYFIFAGVPTQIFTSANLPAEQLSYQYPDSLATGTYFWTVSAVDEFGNLGRSKEASFTVP